MRLTIAALALAAATPALAQDPFCGKRDPIIAKLESKYQETVREIGITNNGDLIQVAISPAGSWTVLLTNKDGWTCVVSTGDDWQSRQVKPGEPS